MGETEQSLPNPKIQFSCCEKVYRLVHVGELVVDVQIVVESRLCNPYSLIITMSILLPVIEVSSSLFFVFGLC